jgi:sugar/nucleoside kinase (ribokinase family)
MQRLSYNPLTRSTKATSEPHSLGLIGHLAIDTILHPKIEIRNSPGGSAAAIATASVQLGTYTSIHSNVGKDYPKEWLEVLENLGVDISNIEFADKLDSLAVEFIYDEKGDLKSLECNDRLLTQLNINNLPRTECVHICPAEPQDQIELVKSVKHGKRIISMSFSEYFLEDYKKMKFSDLINWSDIDIVFLNEEEAMAIINEKNPENQALKFFDKGAEIVVITLGKEGSLVYDGNEMHHINARDVKVMDPTGCGDSYIGGFLGEYLTSKDIQKAAGMGTYMASLTAQKKGSWAALLSDVDRF